MSDTGERQSARGPKQIWVVIYWVAPGTDIEIAHFYSESSARELAERKCTETGSRNYEVGEVDMEDGE
jgi:hypothetical protein